MYGELGAVQGQDLSAALAEAFRQMEICDSRKATDAEADQAGKETFRLFDFVSSAPANSIADIEAKAKLLRHIIRTFKADAPNWHEPLITTITDGAERLARGGVS